VEKGVTLLLQGDLAQRTSMRLFNTYRAQDPSRSLWVRLSDQTGMLRRFWRELRGEPVDLVHLKTSSGINFHQNGFYALLARWSGLPVLIQIHSGRFEAFYRSSAAPLRAWIRHTLTRASRVAVLSHSWAERVRAISPRALVRVVPNGLGEDELARLGGGEIRRSQVFFLGTDWDDLNPDKGLEDLLDVLPELIRRHPQSCWVLAGLREPEEIHSRLGKRGIDLDGNEGYIHCLGSLGPQEKVQLLKASAILVLPSYFENMPNILLEGMAAGLGVVATDVGAIPEMLGYGEGGLLIPPGDRSALSCALDRLLASPSLVRGQGRRNRATVVREYAVPVVQRKLEEVYREVAGWPDAARVSGSPTGESAYPGTARVISSPRRPVTGP